ncbi:SDR family NAD(P)-dependent oxidoreductase [Pseudomonas sp. GD03944]|uniref:SDR family NAD(P)-dependent oxidoreductase n=1 Tax=Pseudomonas sp. GD03944 TaxID=2975409 RepID=UPI00244B9B49|nr:SDR family NAD(P)-dependent oxidoreductase [Pseudomonas sp. GD03944]MDH1261450.1 SDR family NAD(P)-dependent oxidoreductase [Pseudomonas sp. GD03944]
MTQARRYLLTGASSGIGAALARELASRGYDLALAARREESLQQLAAQLTADFGHKAVVLPLDVTDYAACQDTIGLAHNALGGLDGIVANAGIGLSGKAGSGRFERYRQTVETNLLGAIACLDAATELFREQGHGHLVAIASVAGKRGLPGTAGYSASKAGLISYMEALALELHRSPLDTTLLLPGYIDTPINQNGGPRPFLIGVERGARLIADHIDARTRSAYVPGWPWALIGRLLPLLPTSLMARL